MPVTCSVALAATSLRVSAALLMGLGVIAVGMGVPDALAAGGGVHPVAYAASLSFCTVSASWLNLGWRWLGWRAELRSIAYARQLLAADR